MTRPCAVIFDCDGVLVDSEVLALEVELGALAELGLSYERAAFCRRFMGMHNALFFQELDADCRAATGKPLPADFRDTHRARLMAACEERLCVVAGAQEAVAALAAPKAVASSTGAGFLAYKLKRVQLYDAFAPHIYSADLVARGKPAPDIFLHAAERLAIRPADCLAIEDSANGVRAAVAAGMRVWGFTGGGHCLSETADLLRGAGAERVLSDWRAAGEAFVAWG